MCVKPLFFGFRRRFVENLSPQIKKDKNSRWLSSRFPNPRNSLYIGSMKQIETTFRVRYAETDRMGYVYYGNYAAWFEVGRVELLRSLGTSYRDLEDRGILLPVRDFNVRYHLPVLYDEEVKLITRLSAVENTRLTFDYELYNEAGLKTTSASATLVFVNKDTGKPTSIPEELSKVLKPTVP